MGFELKIYPSGFLGAANVAQTELLDIRAIKHKLFDSAPLNNVPAHTANREVSSLWEDVCAGDKTYKTFEFREKILKVALTAFGTATLRQWVEAQHQSPFHTGYQQKWIEETLQYVLQGVPRELSFNVWQTLVVCGHGDQTKMRSRVILDLIGENAPYQHLTIQSFITFWVQQPKGVDDLISSLYVLFGKR